MIIYYFLMFGFYFIDSASDNYNSKENNSFSEYQLINFLNIDFGLIQENNIVISPICKNELTNNSEYCYNVRENNSAHKNFFYNLDEQTSLASCITNEKVNVSNYLMNLDQSRNIKCKSELKSDKKSSKAYNDTDNKVSPDCSKFNDLNHTLSSPEMLDNSKGSINISDNMFTNQKYNLITDDIRNQEISKMSLFQNQPNFFSLPKSEDEIIDYSDQNTSDYSFNEMKFMYQDLYTDNKEYLEHFYKEKQICLGDDEPNFKINELINKNIDNEGQTLENISQVPVSSFFNNDQNYFKGNIPLNLYHSYCHQNLSCGGSGYSSTCFDLEKDLVEINDSFILSSSSSSNLIKKCKQINEILKDCIVMSKEKFSVVIGLTQIIVEICVINKYKDELNENANFDMKNIIDILENTLETCMKSKNICYLFPEFMLYIKEDVFSNCFEKKNLFQCKAYQYELIKTWRKFLIGISIISIQFLNIQNTLSLHILRNKLRKFTYFALEPFLDQEFRNLYQNLIRLEIRTKDKSKNNFFNKDIVAYNTNNDIKYFNKRCGIYFRFIFLFQKYEKNNIECKKRKSYVKKELFESSQKIIIREFEPDLRFFFSALQKSKSFKIFVTDVKTTKKFLLPFIKIISYYLLKLQKNNIIFYQLEQKMESIVNISINILKNFNLIYIKNVIEEKNKKNIVIEKILSRKIMSKCVKELKTDFFINESERLFYNFCTIELNYFKM